MNGRFRIGERIISNRYEIQEEVGSGGFGVVLRCLDTRLGRVVAIKISLDSHPEAVPRFLREAKTIAKLEHPNIARVYDSGEEDGCPYIVQEFLPGSDLSEVAQRDELALLDKLDVLIQIARGLAAAHKCNIVHRDVSPRNVRILLDGTIKIVDFGLAKFVGNTQGVTTRGFGTPGYYPPEVNSVGKIDLSFDVFSFGVIAYELLTGRRIFGGDQESYRMFLGGEVLLPPLWEEIPFAPAKLVAVIEKCVRIKRRERFPNAMVLLEWLEGLPAQILPHGNRTGAPAPRGRMFRKGESPSQSVGARAGALTSKAMLVKRVKRSSATKVESPIPLADPRLSINPAQSNLVEKARQASLRSRIVWITALAGFGMASVLAGYSIAPRFDESSIGRESMSLMVRAVENVKKLSANTGDADRAGSTVSGDTEGDRFLDELRASLKSAQQAKTESEAKFANASEQLIAEKAANNEMQARNAEGLRSREKLFNDEVVRSRKAQRELDESQKKVASLVHQAVILEKETKSVRSQLQKVTGELNLCKQATPLKGQVMDPETGFYWTSVDNGGDIVWLVARDYCAELDLGGVKGWRLGTVAELAKISSSSGSIPCRGKNCKTRLGIKLSAIKVWSSSVLAVDRVEVFDFDRQVAFDHNPAHALGVRALCVRGN